MLTAAGREAKLGSLLDCPLCDPPRWPPALWRSTALLTWSRLLLDSYHRWTGRHLLTREATAEREAETLFFAPFVVVSHGLGTDPILNYGNRTALELWETEWATFIRTPSRLTAEPVHRTERARMLERVAREGFIDDYRGVRLSLNGRRFLVERALVWNVVGPAGGLVGQAASFSSWTFLEPS